MFTRFQITNSLKLRLYNYELKIGRYINMIKIINETVSKD